mmetsp:Transcript_124584/g.248575  ORF Transcript_124584/g.248575 Transcript_124584/m.248575 type:complete len:303 (-) Transcript_124584:27-935(-)
MRPGTMQAAISASFGGASFQSFDSFNVQARLPAAGPVGPAGPAGPPGSPKPTVSAGPAAPRGQTKPAASAGPTMLPGSALSGPVVPKKDKKSKEAKKEAKHTRVLPAAASSVGAGANRPTSRPSDRPVGPPVGPLTGPMGPNTHSGRRAIDGTPGPSPKPPGYVEPAATKVEKKKKTRVRAGAAKPPRPPEKKEARDDDDDDDDHGYLMATSHSASKKSTKHSKLFGDMKNACPKAKAKARCSSFLMRMRVCNKKEKAKNKTGAVGRKNRARIQELKQKRQEEKNKIFGNAPLVIGSSDEDT